MADTGRSHNKVTYLTHIPTDIYGMSANKYVDWEHKCKCCNRNLGLPNGNRGLCDACEEDIPNHIPEEQYLTYMKELWRIK